MKALSGGECNRLLLAKLFSKSANFLVMDEPTNDLDIETLELLEELLMQFEGTILLVSHDRHFMDNVVSSTIVVKGNGSIEEYVGGYSDWIRQGGSWPKNDEGANKKVVSQEDQTGAAVESQKGVELPKKSKKLSYKLQRELDQLPKQIEEMEEQLDALRGETAESDFYQRDHKLVAGVLEKLSAMETDLEQAYQRWTELEEMCE